MSNSDIISSLTLIVLCIGTAVAILALSGWKNEMKGKVKYDLARRLLHELYDIRNAIDYVRRYRSMTEDIKAYNEQYPEEKITNTDPDFEARIHLAGFRATWPILDKAITAYKVDLLEAETLLNKDAKQKLTLIISKTEELRYANEQYIQSFLGKGASINDEPIRQRRSELVMLIFGQPSVFEDKYKKELSEIIEQIEKYLRPYLGLE